MPPLKFDPRRLAVILHDLFMVIIAWSLALNLRLFFQLSEQELLLLSSTIPIALLAQSLIFWHYGLYQGIWRFASLPDLWNILRSVFVGSLVMTLILFLTGYLDDYPRSALLLYPLLLALFLGLPRLFYRLWREQSFRFLLEPHPNQRVLIIGAGCAGETLVRDMRRGREYLPIALLDDDKYLHGARLHGVPIVGGINRLQDTVQKLSIDLIVLAIPSASNLQMQRAVEYCEQAQVAFRTLPKPSEENKKPASLAEIQDVSIFDLLGREKIQLDWRIIEAGLGGKVVLVSGGGGSIGSELCLQIAKLRPQALVILESCEYNLHEIMLRLAKDSPETRLFPCLGDVCDLHTVNHTLKTYRPQVIFHAAAYKHVPMLQHQTREAIHNNVLGTRTLAEAAVKHKCHSFVLISTDKAVNPTSVMGATKRVAEIFCQALNGRAATRFITVRFGNVLGSAGSVVPLFKRQIAHGGPVTVTHPDITRYFMTIPEACQLILQAGAMGYGGEIFVLDMGTPIKIRYLAEQLIRLSGKEPDKEIEIVYTGLRPGEKLYEELFHPAEERMSKTRHTKIMLASHRPANWDALTQALDEFIPACDNYDETKLRTVLLRLVPEFHEPEY